MWMFGFILKLLSIYLFLLTIKNGYKFLKYNFSDKYGLRMFIFGYIFMLFLNGSLFLSDYTIKSSTPTQWLLLIVLISFIVSIYFLINKTYIEHYPNGKIKLKGKTKYGKRVGQFLYFDENESLLEIQIYKNGEIINQRFINPENGEVWKTINPDKIYFDFIPSHLKYDKTFLLGYIQNQKRKDKYSRPSKDIGYLDEFIHDKEFILQIISVDDYLFFMYKEKFGGDKELLLEVLKSSWVALKFASNELKENRIVVLEAVRSNGQALQYASDILKRNKEIVIEAIKSNAEAFEYASENLKNDFDFLYQLLKINSIVFKYLSEDIRADREFVKYALNLDGTLLEYVSYEFKKDYELVLIALNKSGWHALKFSQANLNKDIVWKSLNISNLKDRIRFESYEKYIGKEFSNDIDLILSILLKFNDVNLLKTDWKVKRNAVTQFTLYKNFGFDFLLNEIVVGMQLPGIVLIVSGVLSFIPYLIDNIFGLSITKYYFIVFGILIVSYALVITLFYVFKLLFSYLKISGILKNKEAALNLIKSFRVAMLYVDNKFKSDKNFILEALNQNYRCFEYVTPELKNDPEILDLYNRLSSKN